MKMKMACNKSDILGSVEPFRTVGSRLVSFMLGRPSCPDSIHGCLLEPRGGWGEGEWTRRFIISMLIFDVLLFESCFVVLFEVSDVIVEIRLLFL